MGYKEDLEKRIEREKQKISELASQVKYSETLIVAWQEALKMLSKSGDAKTILRSVGDTKKAYDFLKQTGRAMSVVEILEGIGKPNTQANRASLASSLYRAANRGSGVKKVRPGVFALDEPQTEVKTAKPVNSKQTLNLPPDFGKEE